MPAKKKAAKLQPAVETITLVTPSIPVGEGGGYNGRFYFDIAKAASIVNRRGYRQGRQWMVAGFTFLSAGTGSVGVTKLPVNWVTSNSWEKTFRAWDHQQKKALKETSAQSTMASYRDFKVYFDDDHRAANVGTGTFELLPQDATGNVFLTGEWDYSQVVIPNEGGVAGATAEYALSMLGDDTADSKSVVKAYALSRAMPEPTSPEDQNPQLSLFTEMFDVGNEGFDVIANATDSNDDMPYDRLNYPGQLANGPGGQTHAYANIVSPGTGVELSHAPGGVFPCGLVVFDWTEAANNANLAILVHMVPGPYRGYLAPPMTEM